VGTVTTVTLELAPLVARYASRRHKLSTHHAASPLGAWLLLALAAPEPDPSVEEALGTDVAHARALATSFMSTAPACVKSALALWVDPAEVSAGLESWASLLPEATRGPVPTQEEADAWARARTGDLVKAFPVSIEDDTTLVMATALAVKESWLTPFQVVPARTQDGVWGGKSLLRGRGGSFVIDSSLGLLGVHVAATASMDVVSVIAEPGVDALAVLEAAHGVALLPGLRSGSPAGRLALSDVPQVGHSWEVTSEVRPSRSTEDSEDSVAELPAWRSSTREDLDGEEDGLVRAGTALARLLVSGGRSIRAAQSTVASYDTFGFEAASVTALSMRAGSAYPRERALVRTLELEFSRPHAVVATLAGTADAPFASTPLFSAWISEAVEPTHP
jgi:hypothetical protein